MKWYAYFFILGLWMVSGCCKDEPNPCQGKTEVKAKFSYNNLRPLLVSWMKPYWIKYDWTTLPTSDATWTIDDDVKWTSIEWHIGSEVIKNVTFISRVDFPDNTDIPVTLIITGTPDKSCFPNDDGRDTLTKIYHFTSKKERLLGTFRGAFVDVPNHKDTFEFKIFYDPTSENNIVDTFPFTSCRNLIPLSNDDINEDFSYAFGRTTCPDPDTNRRIGSFYIRYLDNNSNKLEVILNASSNENYKNYPKFLWRGYKK